jgi:hypothetical protein
MKKSLFVLVLFLLTAFFCQAQTKVFKEVGEDMSMQMSAILQDGSLVGYLAFTQLERASADSFNYKITIMDENLNDIGTIKFREQKLILKAVCLEQDVLCVAYLKSNFIGAPFNNSKESKNGIANAKFYISTQFLSLDGKILKTNSIKTDAKPDLFYTTNRKSEGIAKLKYDVQLRNLPQKGFACFYGDETRSNLVIYSPAGKQLWLKQIKEDAEGFSLLTSGSDAYLLLKKKDAMLQGGFELLGYDTNDSTTFPKYFLKDKKGNSLKPLTFENDPASGKPYISGTIIDQRNGNQFLNANQLTRGTYAGLFTIDLNGHKKGDIRENFSYWDDGSQSMMNAKGRFNQNKSYALFASSFKDFQGNTFFVGSSVVHRVKWVAVGFTIITLPLIIPPLGILSLAGSQKSRLDDAILVKQNSKGAITFDNSVHAESTGFTRGMVPFELYDNRSFYTVTNPETKTDYLVVDDVKNITIYNVTQKKVARTVPHKDGNLHITVFPAKEGHLMVSEYNKKEKYTRFSIESL